MARFSGIGGYRGGELSAQCVPCPDRSLIGKCLARVGIFAADENCPGKTVIDHRKATMTEERIGKRIATQDEGREDVCHKDTPFYPSLPEQHVEERVTSTGQRWIVVTSGEPEAVAFATINIDASD